MTAWSRLFLGGLVLSSVACEGALGGNSTAEGDSSGGGSINSPTVPANVDDPNESPVEFSCDAEAAPNSPGMRRLTRQQYENTLLDLLVASLGDTEGAQAAYNEIAPAIELVPPD